MRIFLILILIAFPVHSAEIFFTPPLVNEDGSAYLDRGSYRLECGASSGVYSFLHEEPDTGQSSLIVDLAYGSHFCILKAIDTTGNQSASSNELAFTLVPPDTIAPAAPILLSVQ